MGEGALAVTITNYGTLKSAIQARLGRSDTVMGGLIPDFIYSTHSKMMLGDDVDGVPPLRFADMLTETTLTPAGGVAALPDDYLGIKRIYTNSSDTTALLFRPPEDWYSMSLEGQSGIPRYFTIEGASLKIAPMNATDLKLLYYARIDQPEADADTNAIFARAPHAYLYGAVAEAYDHMRQHDRAGMYAKRFASAVRSLNESSDMTQNSGGPLLMMPSVLN
jgi:hypothetical protein